MNEKNYLIFLSYALAKPCDGQTTYEMLMCLDKEFRALEKEAKKEIDLQKDKIPTKNFLALENSQAAWLEVASNYCRFKNKDGGTIDSLNGLSCLIDDLKKRIKNIKADFKAFRLPAKKDAKKQENAKISYENESKIFKKNVKALLDSLLESKDELDGLKAQDYKSHISAWRDFASSYCAYQGGGFVCLNALYKAKNELISKDLKSLSEVGQGY